MKFNSESLTQAKNFAYRLLNYRERSVAEIEDRLVRKGFKKEIAAQAIAGLKTLKLLDDYRFAKTFAESRIKSKPSGLALIRSKLRSFGIAQDTIDSVICDIERDYDEYAAAYHIATSKAERFSNISDIKAKRRMYGYLLRRRFKKDVIYKVLDEVFKKVEGRY